MNRRNEQTLDTPVADVERPSVGAPAERAAPVAKSAATRSSKASTPARRKTFAIEVVATVAMLLVAEMFCRAVPKEPPLTGAPLRAANVVALPPSLENIPQPDKTGPQLLLIGSSQAYSMPGMAPGMPLRPDRGESTIDVLAAHLDLPNARFYRVAEAGFLPFESLVAMERLYQAGYDPKVVIISWTWTFFARDRAVRGWVHDSFRDRGLVEELARTLAATHANDEVTAAVREQADQAAAELATEQRRSMADWADLSMTDWGQKHTGLMGRAADIRARIYLDVIEHGLARLARGNLNAVRDVVDGDLRFNLECMRVLVELLAQRGAKVFAYITPERGGMPPLTDPTHLDEVFGKLATDLAPTGLVLVDARKVVPPDQYGWSVNYPDRAHFGESGHRQLAEFLLEQGKKHGIYEPLRRE